LISGFLGSGKTTLIQRLLAAQPASERLALLVNEFGSLGVDGRLLSGFPSEVMELSGGCICCSLRADFQTALDAILKKFGPDRILVEASGVAAAGDIARVLDEPGWPDRLVLGSMTTLVDPRVFKRREVFGDFFLDQIQSADLVIVNKLDLAEPGEVETLVAELAGLNPEARIVPAVQAGVDRELVLAPRDGAGGMIGGHSHVHDPAGSTVIEPGGITALEFDHPGMMDPERLERFLEGLPWEVFRVKGFVIFPTGPVVVNHTFGRPELIPAADAGSTRLVVIGWRLEADRLRADLEDCLLPA
jgi:G3E family GTPase